MTVAPHLDGNLPQPAVARADHLPGPGPGPVISCKCQCRDDNLFQVFTLLALVLETDLSTGDVRAVRTAETRPHTLPPPLSVRQRLAGKTVFLR